ncbi:WhiB family transcriptional regulator [Gordonia oleivorans]|uniref:WhiB family transcriptional regulator n=1 Tax=Gordonia oleivorans TaxID=3156618 RepID=UPI003CCCF5E9
MTHRSLDVVDLISHILQGSADLRGASCVARPRLFDPDISYSDAGFRSQAEREQAVKALCVGCPVRGECWEWATSGARVVGPTAATMFVGSALRVRPSRQRSMSSGSTGAPTASTRQ